MHKSEAIKIFESSVLADNPDCALLADSTLERESCFVFFYQSKQYIQSGNFRDMVVGQGPVIVCKETGRLFQTGSVHETEHYVNAFEACGDPFGELTSRILISSWSEGANVVKAIKCIRAATGEGLAHSKYLIDQVLDGEGVVVELSALDKVKITVACLAEHGFGSEQLWSNQGANKVLQTDTSRGV